MTDTLAELVKQIRETMEEHEQRVTEYEARLAEMHREAASLIRQERDQAGLTQTALGERIGITHTMVSLVERGHEQFSLARLEQVVGELEKVREEEK